MCLCKKKTIWRVQIHTHTKYGCLCVCVRINKIYMRMCRHIIIIIPYAYIHIKIWVRHQSLMVGFWYTTHTHTHACMRYARARARRLAGWLAGWCLKSKYRRLALLHSATVCLVLLRFLLWKVYNIARTTHMNTAACFAGFVAYFKNLYIARREQNYWNNFRHSGLYIYAKVFNDDDDDAKKIYAQIISANKNCLQLWKNAKKKWKYLCDWAAISFFKILYSSPSYINQVYKNKYTSFYFSI